MSFYLLPAANYQTQQKLKEQMEGKKRELRKHSVSSSKKPSRRPSAAPSITAPSTHSSRTPRSSISSNGNGNESFMNPRKMSIMSSDSRSSNETALTAPSRRTQETSPATQHSKHDGENIYDQYTPYDKRSAIRSSSSSTVGSIDSARRPSAVSSSYNYSSNVEMNQVLKVSKQHALQKKSTNTKLSSSMAKLSIEENSGFDSECNEVKVEFKSVNFSGPETGPEPPKVVAKIPEDTIASDEDSEEEPHQHNLTKVYSNVSSIFSTKNSPSLYKSHTASTSQSNSPTGSHKHENDSIIASSKPNKFSRFKKKFSV